MPYCGWLIGFVSFLFCVFENNPANRKHTTTDTVRMHDPPALPECGLRNSDSHARGFSCSPPSSRTAAGKNGKPDLRQRCSFFAFGRFDPVDFALRPARN